MIKRLALGLFFISTPIWAADQWEACGSTQDQAVSNLAKTIISQVQSETKLSATSKGFFGIEVAEHQASSKTQSQSNLKLSDIHIEQRGSEICASIDKASLLKFSKALYDQVKTYQLNNLPQAVKPKIGQLDIWLNDLQQMKALMLVFAEDFSAKDQQALAAQQKNLQDERNQLHPQFVRFNIKGEGASLKVDGRAYAAGSEVYLPAGEHDYSIQTKETCPARGSFVLEKNRDQVIEIDLADYRFPTFNFNSNKPLATRLTIDGNESRLGKSYPIRKCSGKVSVEAIFQDGQEIKKQGDTYILKPGLVVSEDFTFYSQAELMALQAQSDSFTSGQRVEIKYAYSTLPDEANLADIKVEPMHQLKLNYLYTQDWLRHGPGIMLAQGWNEKMSGDLVYNLGLQLTGLGAENKPLHLGTLMTLVPFVNLQAGVGYHQYSAKSGERVVRQFPVKLSDPKEDIKRDYVVAKLGFGVDLAFNATMAVQFFAEQALTQEENLIFGAGLSLKLPESVQ